MINGLVHMIMINGAFVICNANPYSFQRLFRKGIHRSDNFNYHGTCKKNIGLTKAKIRVYSQAFGSIFLHPCHFTARLRDFSLKFQPELSSRFLFSHLWTRDSSEKIRPN